MKGLLLKLLMIIGGFSAGLWGYEAQYGFRLPTYPQEDRDLGLVQKLLFFIAEKQLQSPQCCYSYDPDGYALMVGPVNELNRYVIELGKALENISEEGITEERFEEVKEAFIASLENSFDEQEIAKEIQWEMLENVRGSLHPIPLMMSYMSPTDASSDKPLLAPSEFSTDPYYQLRLTPDDQKNISKMITNLGELGWFGLLKKKGEMEKLGDKVFPVHPMRFIGYIVSKSSLKKQLPKIMGDFVKRKSFLWGHGKRIGFSQRMTNESNSGNLESYLPGFAKQVGVSEESLQPYFNSHDWEGMIKYLMN